MDIEIGDDLLYITRKSGEITKLNDEEYNFTSIKIPKFVAGYNYEIQVRYKNTDEYVLYDEGVTNESVEEIKFNRDDIVGVNLVIKNLDRTFECDRVEVNIYFYPNDYANGSIWNFCSLQAYIKDNDGNRILHNEVTLDNYTTDMTKLKIADYDMETYGRYIQRACASIAISEGDFYLASTKSRSSLKNNVKDEKYDIKYDMKTHIQLDYYDVNKDVIIKQYDILPDGMKLSSIKEEIVNNIDSNLNYRDFKLKDGTIFKNSYEIDKYIKKNTTVDIDYNYNNSGRTKISIIYNLNGIDWSYYSEHIHFPDILICTVIRTEIPYDSIKEYGTSYKNDAYTMWGNQEYGYYQYNNNVIIKDNGKYEILANDIDNDGNIDEELSYSSDTLNITHAVSSKQAVIKQVRTDMTNGKFVSDMAEATAGSEYTYKLRIATGANSLKDLIIYDNLETILDENGNDISGGWKGDFLGVDTTYAKSKGYAPIVYYSEEINPGKLTEDDNKWIELTDTTDKSKVKSICVDLRYKDDGTEMELPGNDLVYVLVNMRAPNDITLITSANNMFNTNWRAKDPFGTVIDNVEGIYSNQVNVSIFKEENRKQDIVGSKIWEDNGFSARRPKSVTVKLFQDGIEYMRCEVTEEDNWKYVFKEVPVYKNSMLEKYEYRIEEEKVPYYETTYNEYDIINTLSGKDISGTKTWDDNWNNYNTRPESVTIKLMQDGIEYMRCEVTEDEEGEWNYIFEDVPIYKNDSEEEYVYTIEEVEVPGYENEVEYDELYDQYKITNTLKTKDIEVTKIWDDKDNANGLRPKFILLKLYDGENLVNSEYVREENEWKCTFYKLPEYRADGSKIEYRVDEEVEEYREEYLGGGTWDYENNFENEGDFELYNKYYIKQINGTTITNKYVDQNERIKVTGTKVWKDNDNIAGKRPDSIVLQIKNGEEVVSEGVVTEENNWSYEFEVPKYDEEGNEISYHIDEKETPKFYEKELTNETTVTNRFVVPDEKVKIPVIKLWEDEENKYNKRPNSITLQVYNGEKLVAESKVNEKDNWRYEFELPKYDEVGNEIEYTVNEKEENKYYEKRISGYTVINKCIYEPTTDTSDIDIFVYVLIFFIAIIGIIIGIIFVRKSK